MKQNSLQKKITATIKEILPKFPNMHGEIAIADQNEVFYHEHFSYIDAVKTAGSISLINVPP